MFGIESMMNTGWQLVQSTLSTIGGVLFSKSPQSKATRRLIGLDQLVLTKGYWVDRQREVFEKLRSADNLVLEDLQSQLDQLLGQLGARLGSPAVMLIELDLLSAKLSDGALLNILADAKASIQASMIKDPKIAYANLLADTELLLEDTSMHFINSPKGRSWLEAYRPFFSAELIEKALIRIEDYAYAQLGKIFAELTFLAESPEQIEAKVRQGEKHIKAFSDWRKDLKNLPMQTLEHEVHQKLSEPDFTEEGDSPKQSPSFSENAAKRSNAWRLWSSVSQLLSLPVALISRYPRVSSVFMLASRVGLAMAQPQQGQRIYPETHDVSAVFKARELDKNDWHAMWQDRDSAHEAASAYHARHLQEGPEACFSGYEQVGWVQSFAESLGGNSVAVGSDGTVVSVGETAYNDGAGTDALVARYEDDGSLYAARYLGGSEDDSASAIAIGLQGQVVLVGKTNSNGALADDVLLAQYASPSVLDWAVRMGGPANDFGKGLAVGSSGQIVLVGNTDSYGVGGDILLAQYDSQGFREWVQVLGGVEHESGNSVAITPSGRIVLVGSTQSYGAGYSDVFLAQYNDGSLEWAQTLGGQSSDYGNGVAIGPAGQIILVGASGSYGAGSDDVLLAQYDSSGNLEWASVLGGPFSDMGYDITFGLAGQIVLVGSTSSYGAGGDVLVAQYDQGGMLEWAQTLGGESQEIGYDIAVKPDGQIVLAGKIGTKLLVAQMSSNGKVKGLSSEISHQFITESIIEHRIDLITNQTVSPSAQDLTGGITSIKHDGQSGMFYSGAIPSDEVTALSAIPKGKLENPVLTHEYSLLPSSMFVSGGVVLAVDVTDIDWLSYDSQSQLLSGTPVDARLGLAEFQIHMQLEGSQGVVSVSVGLCVTKFGDFGDNMLFGGRGPDEAYAVEFGREGQSICVGSTGSYGAGSSDVLLASNSGNGAFEWAQTLGGPFSDHGLAVAIGPLGQIVVVGKTFSYGAGGLDGLVAQYSTDGSIEWVRTLGGSSHDHANGVAVGEMGQVLMVGVTLSYGAGGSDVLLAQYGSNGDFEWAVTLGDVSSDIGYALAFGTAGQIVLVGETSSYGEGDFDALVMSVNADTSLNWAQTLRGSFDEELRDLVVGPDGQIIVVGWTASYGAGSRDVLLTKLTPDGRFEWAQALGSGAYDSGYGLALGTMGQILLVGTTDVNSYHDALLVELDSGGAIEWAQTFSLPQEHHHGPIREIARSVAIGSTGQIMVVGQYFVETYPDVLMAWFDAQGNPISHHPGFSVEDCAFSSTMIGSESIRNITEIEVGTVPTSSSQDVTNFEIDSLAYFPPVHTLLYDTYFEIDFKNYLLAGFERIYSFTLAGSFTVPSWLTLDRESLVVSGTPVGDVRGKYLFRMEVDDEYSRKWVSFALNVVNSKPYFSRHSEFESTVGRLVVPMGSYFSDRENDQIVSFAIGRINGTQAAPIASIDAETGRFFGTTLSGDQGRYQFNITATDPYGGIGWQVITLDVVNTPPVRSFVFEESQLVTIGNEPFRYSFPSSAFIDHDGDAVSYDAVLPDFLSYDNAAHLIFGSPSSSDAGTYQIIIQANDNYGGSSNASFVLEVNTSPILSNQPEPILTNFVGHHFERSLPGNFFIDPDGDTLSYTLTEDVQHIIPAWLRFESVNRTLSGAPTSNPHRAQPLRFRVDDGRGGSAFADVDLQIPNAGPRPERGIQNQAAAINQVKTVVVPGDAFLEPDNDEILYQLSSVDGSPLPAFTTIAANSITFAPRSGDQGQYHLFLIASDPYQQNANVSFTIDVTNRSPFVSEALPASPIVTEARPFLYTFPTSVFIDPDGDALSYAATYPSFLSFDAVTRSFVGTPSSANRGQHLLTIMARDPYNAEASGQVSVIVNGNPVENDPISALAAAPVGVFYSYTFPATVFIDPDGDSLAYQLTEDIQHIVPSWLSFEATTRTLSGTPDLNPHRNQPLRFHVDDGRGGFAFFEVDFDIPNSAPQVQAGVADQSIAVNQVQSLLIPVDAFHDVDQDNLRYTLSFISGQPQGWLSLAGNVLTMTPRSGDQGHYELRIGAQDGYGGQTETTFAVSVPNTPPALLYAIPQPGEANAREDWVFELSADNFADQDQDVLSYHATTAGGQTLPTWMSFNPIRRQFIGQPTGRDRGNLAIKVVVSDGHGGSAEGFFNLTIANSAPALSSEDRYFDQQVSKLDGTLVFAVPALQDPDGDPIVYRAEMLDGSPLPPWIRFNPDTRKFYADPANAPAGNYPLVVVSTDSQGVAHRESFSLAVNSAPTVPEEGLQSSVRTLLPTLFALSLAGAAIAALVWRERRIHKVNQMVISWSKAKKAPASSGISSLDLEQALDKFQQSLKSESSMTVLNDQYEDFQRLASSYYKRDPDGGRIFTRLLADSGVLQTCIAALRAILLEGDSTNEKLVAYGLGISNILYSFLLLMLELHTGRGLIIAKSIKDDLSQSIRYIASRMEKRTLMGMRVYHNLKSCREAIICMLDTDGLGRLFLSMARHIISPIQLFKDLRGIVFDIPAKWYMDLLYISNLLPKASLDPTALRTVQSIAAKQSDKRFRYGLASVYIRLLCAIREESMQRALINGQAHRGRVTQLGLVHLLTPKRRLCRKKDNRIQILLQYLLNERSADLPPISQKLLQAFLVSHDAALPSLDSSRRASRRTSLGIRRGSQVTASDGAAASESPLVASFMVNPMAASELSSRRARAKRASQDRVSTVPTTVRDASHDSGSGGVSETKAADASV